MSDADEIRAVAGRIDGVASGLRAAAGRTARGDGVSWHGVGADAYRKQLADDAARISALARDVDRLAADLRSYARAVQHRQDTVAKPVQAVTGWVAALA